MALFKKKSVVSEEHIRQQHIEKTTQQWMPIADIRRNIVYRKDDHILGMLRVQPLNIELLSENEKKRIVDSLTEMFNGETEGLQIFCVGRPVDLNNYLEWLQEKAKEEQDFTRKTVLKGYIQQASEMASSGETVERRFYIIVSRKNGNKADIELLNKLNELQYKLLEAELTSHVCNEDELLDVFSLFANPLQAAFEVVENNYDIPSLLEI